MSKSRVSLEVLKRVQSAEAKRNGGGVAKGSFTSRIQKTLAKRGN